MNPIIEELSKIGIVPVIALNDAKDALPLAKALIAGGLPCAEVTFRTDAAEESIKLIAKDFVGKTEFGYRSRRNSRRCFWAPGPF